MSPTGRHRLKAHYYHCGDTLICSLGYCFLVSPLLPATRSSRRNRKCPQAFAHSLSCWCCCWCWCCRHLAVAAVALSSYPSSSPSSSSKRVPNHASSPNTGTGPTWRSLLLEQATGSTTANDELLRKAVSSDQKPRAWIDRGSTAAKRPHTLKPNDDGKP